MDLISKQAEIVNDPLFFQNICDYIVGGGTLVEFCAERDISYPATLKWIRMDVTRRQLYERAQDDGDAWQIDKIRRELRDLGDIDLSLMLDEDGKQKPFSQWPHKLQRAVASIKHTKDGTEIKFHDKIKALELMGKTAGMFKEKVEHSGKITLEQLVAKSMKKVTE
jgi:hypothetical protein